MKFKIGDKVRILPSAVNGGVSKKDVGKIGKIIDYRSGGYFNVLMCDDPSPFPWGVCSDQMEPVVRIGQQLLFLFMEQEDEVQSR